MHSRQAGRLVVIAIVLGSMSSCRGRVQPLGDPERWNEGECIATYTIDHEHSPLAELRELGGTRDDFQERFPAATIDPTKQRPVTATAGFRLEDRPIAWFSADLDLVVLEGAAFAPLRKADPIRNAGGELRRVGRVTSQTREALGDRRVIELLLRLGVIQTYWHLGADLCLSAEPEAKEGKYRAIFSAVHHYATSKDVASGYGFSVTIDETGQIVVVDRDAANQ